MLTRRAGIKLRTLALVLIALAACRGAAAQTDDGGPDPTAAPLRLGPFLLNPRLQLTNFGVDTNVFNAPLGQAQKDVTATLSPMTDLWLRIGPSWLQATVREDLLWFETYSSERSANSNDVIKLNVPLNRLHLAVSQTYLNTHDRPGFEIDERAPRTEYGGDVAADVRGFAKIYFGVDLAYQKTAFSKDAVFLDISLQNELNRTSTTAGGYVRYQATPLTQFTVRVSQVQDRFEFSSLRDSNSTEAAVTVSFDPHAVIQGSASVGYRHFHALAGGLPDYVGATVHGDLTYSLQGSTRFQAQFNRDISYSYDITQPYYLQTGVVGSVAQQVFGPVDVVVRGGYSQLAYRDRSGAVVALANRNDYIHSYGGGVGYHVSKDLRIGFNVDRQHRLSGVPDRQYDDLRYGTSITYGF